LCDVRVVGQFSPVECGAACNPAVHVLVAAVIVEAALSVLSSRAEVPPDGWSDRERRRKTGTHTQRGGRIT
jgi:hypothetical protein